MPDDEFPFILSTGRVLEHWHGGTLTRHSKLDELYPEARVALHPADAALLDIHDSQARRHPAAHRRPRPRGEDPRTQGLRGEHRAGERSRPTAPGGCAETGEVLR